MNYFLEKKGMIGNEKNNISFMRGIMKIINNIFMVFSLFAFIAATPVLALDKEQKTFDTSPTKNNGKKWRIAYYEGGPYIDYQKYLTETVKGLMKLGWIDSAVLPKQTGEETKLLWDWLVSDANSQYLEFMSDAHYSANWDEKERKETVKKIMNRLNTKKDIDLLIAMGTWAGKDFANDDHSTPTLVLSASDPLSAGIIKSIDDSGFDHLNAAIDPFVYERQIRVFHEMINFKKLGIAYEDTEDGRSYAQIDVAEKVAKDRGFEIVKCYTVSDIGDMKKEAESVSNCFKEFSKTADAIYVTQQGGVRLETIPGLVKIAQDYRIPTFSQAGSEEVKYGFLASISQAGFKYFGEFHAKTMAQVFNGAKPNQLTQCFEQPPKIALNLKTAEIIGFDPPVVLLGASDEIFTEISFPE
jgi:ABC-type uncharacterized transport system substrate-binding protein